MNQFKDKIFSSIIYNLSEKDDSCPIFIIGSGRCGSTLLSSALNCHPKIYFPKENTFVISLLKKWMQTPKGRKKQIIANVLNGQHLWIDKKEDLLHKIAGLHKEEISFPKCIQAIFNEASQELNKTNIRWGDQTVSNSNYILSLKCQFPKSKIIYLTRDPRAVASSYFKINKKYYTLEKVIKKWKNAYSKFKILENKYPKDVYLLNYDNLVSNFKNEISLLIGWLKEDPALLELNNRFELASHLIEPGSSHHTNLANEISKDSIHKWKNELNTAEIEIIEKHLLEEYVKLCV